MTTQNFIEIVGFVISVLAIVWNTAETKHKLEASIASLEKNFYKDLDAQGDTFRERTAALEHSFDIYVQTSGYERNTLKLRVDALDDECSKSFAHINKRISGAVVFDRMEQRIITLAEVVKNQGNHDGTL